MKRNPVLLLVFLTAGCVAVVAPICQASETVRQNSARTKPQFTISRETTFFTQTRNRKAAGGRAVPAAVSASIGDCGLVG